MTPATVLNDTTETTIRRQVDRYEATLRERLTRRPGLAPIQPQPDHILGSRGVTWNVARTNPQRERRAMLALEERGFRVYLPMLTRFVRHARRKPEDADRPLFVGYLFVGLRPEEQSVYTVETTDGIAEVLRNATKPVVVSADTIAAIALSEITGQFDGTKPQPGPRFRPGDPVRVTGALGSDLAARIMRVRAEDRIWVVLEESGFKVEVGTADVVPA